MKRFLRLLMISFTIVLTACGTAVPGSNITPIIGTASVSTASVGSAIPVIITELPPNYTPPPTPIPPTLTPIPTLPGGIGPTELKYRLLAEFPDLFFCDPDYYPVARDDEMDLARQRFPELQANTEEFDTILAHNNLTGLSTFSDDQKLLIYREHKKLAAIPFEPASGGYQFQIQVAKTEGNGELVKGLIDGQGRITVQERTATIATCPICLAVGTLIDTPAGLVPVQNLRPGVQVWTVDKNGTRVAQPLIRTSRTVVPSTHRVIHLVLDDGRELWVSPGHPSIDGRSIGQLQVGDALDSARVLSAESTLYRDYATYDVLPAGGTGYYWANGILIASSLANER